MAVQQPTKLEYYDNMWKLESQSTILSYFQSEDGRRVLNVESTIFHPQGGGQPSDTGFIVFRDSQLKFIVHDVRSKDGVVFHYGEFEGAENEETEVEFQKGMKVDLQVDGSRRRLNSRLHSAGHLLDACMRNVGLGHLEPSKGYHFSDGPFVEYKGTVPQSELQCKREKLELEANALISRGGTVYAATLPYDEAAQLCDSHLPDYIPKNSYHITVSPNPRDPTKDSPRAYHLLMADNGEGEVANSSQLLWGSTPRIVKLGDNPGCPCGGTHVHDISDIKSIKISQIRTKKGLTKVFYTIGA